MAAPPRPPNAGPSAGVGFHFNESWMPDFDDMYGKPGDGVFARNVPGAKLTILSR